MSSADTTPISPARFAAALTELSVPMLQLKVLEIRNAIAHLQYSNDQLKPFADGTAAATDSTTPGTPDPDCVDAIRENEAVVERMAERIALVQREVEGRGVAWDAFTSKEETEAAVTRAREEQQQQQEDAEVTGIAAQINGNRAEEEQQSSPWTDGTFQTGTIRNGALHMDAQPPGAPRTNGGGAAGGRLSDEQLRVAMEERMRQMTTEDEDEADGGMHL